MGPWPVRIAGFSSHSPVACHMQADASIRCRKTRPACKVLSKVLQRTSCCWRRSLNWPKPANLVARGARLLSAACRLMPIPVTAAQCHERFCQLAGAAGAGPAGPRTCASAMLLTNRSVPFSHVGRAHARWNVFKALRAQERARAKHTAIFELRAATIIKNNPHLI